MSSARLPQRWRSPLLPALLLLGGLVGCVEMGPRKVEYTCVPKSRCGGMDQPPSQPENICHIVAEKPDWGRALLDAEQVYWVEPPLIMAIMYQESSFRADARPPLKKGHATKRQSSAYGYGQFLDGTFADYQQETGNFDARRDEFADTVLAMGWYLQRSGQVLDITRSDAYLHYLAYHDGPYALAKNTYRPKAFVHHAARKVSKRYHRYRQQWQRCTAQIAAIRRSRPEG